MRQFGLEFIGPITGIKLVLVCFFFGGQISKIGKISKCNEILRLTSQKQDYIHFLYDFLHLI